MKRSTALSRLKIRFGLTRKVFLALLFVALMLVALLAGVLHWSFQRGFLDYVRQLELERLDPLAATLIAQHAQRGDWDWLRNRGRTWHDLVRRTTGPNSGFDGPPEFAGRARPGPPHPPPHEQFRPGPHPPSAPHLAPGRLAPDWPPRRLPPPLELGDRRQQGRPDDLEAMQRPLRRGPNPRPPPPHGPDLLRRLTLLDVNQMPVIGPPESRPDALLRALERDGETVGWLRLTPLPGLTDALDLDFQQRQSRIIQIAAVAALLLAALVAIPLARHLLGPIRILTRSMAGLTGGRFQTRTEISRDDELGELAAGFNRLAQTLEQNETLRRRWVAEVAHELRTPLAILTGEMDAVAEGIRPWDERARVSLQAEVAKLNKLVDDLHQLAISDLGALTYRKQKLALEPVLALIVERHAGDCRKAGLRLTSKLAESPSMVVADPDRLTQLFDNLLQNSLRYTDPGGQLTIQTRRQDDQVLIDFQDSPPGVAQAVMPHLFERLFQADESRGRAEGGAGLGLAICRNIVAAHDGSIHAKPSALGGLWIEISLPVLQS